MKRLTLILVALLFLFATAVTPPVGAKDTWTCVRSKNFLLLGNASEKEIRQVGTRLEQFRDVFTRLFTKAKFNTPVPTTVIVFKSDGAYRPFKPNPNVAGYFQPGLDVNYITLSTETRGEQDPFTVIFHEYTHLLVNNTMGNVPVWFNEGLAEYYSSFTISDGQKIVLGKPISNHVFLLRENKMLPLRTLFQVDHNSPYYNERDKQSVFYAESWALMHYLILGNGGQRLAQIDKFVNGLDGAVPMEKAFQDAFGMSFESMEKELRNYIKRDSYPVVDVKFDNKLDFTKDMQTIPISDAEVQAYLGDLLFHSHRAESETYLQKALALDPNLAFANASLGMVRVYQGKLDDARQSLERALSANSDNYLIHYYYAYALSRRRTEDPNSESGFGPESLTRMRSELKRAIELRPDYAESYSLLAFVNLVSGEQIDESIALIKKALTVALGRNDLYFMLAQLYLRKEDYMAGRELLERLSQNTSNEQIRQGAKTLLTQLMTREAEVARYEAGRKERETGGSGTDPTGSTAPRLQRRGAAGESSLGPVDPLSYLQEALRKPTEGEKQIQGTLVRLDCDQKGITFVVKVADRLLRLHTDKFEYIKITAFTSSAGGEITCGPWKTEGTIVVCFVPNTNAHLKFDGVLKSVEFVPKEFKLKSQV